MIFIPGNRERSVLPEQWSRSRKGNGREERERELRGGRGEAELTFFATSYRLRPFVLLPQGFDPEKTFNSINSINSINSSPSR